MSLSGTLQVAKTALAVSQTAIRTHGNNIAGAGDPQYTRQRVNLAATEGRAIGDGLIVGTGVAVESIERQVDQAVVGRLNLARAEGEGAAAQLDWLRQIEATFNELSDVDLSTAASEFFNAFGAAANDPTDAALRRNVLATGDALAARFNDAGQRLGEMRGAAGAQLGDFVQQADSIATQIADLNVQITTSEGGGTLGMANTLRDRRDGLVRELSTYVGVRAIEQKDGALNVYAGSEPLVLGSVSAGLKLDQRVDPATGRMTYTAEFKDGGGPVPLRGGKLDGTADAAQTIDSVLDNIDRLAGGLMFEVNRIHSTGQGIRGHASVVAESAVDDATVPLDSAAAGLDRPPRNGSFALHLRDRTTGRVTSTLVDIALDGTSGGTTLDDLVSDLDAIAGVSASVVAGRLRIDADSAAQELTFGDDTSNTLASLGIGGFFTGSGAAGIEVSQNLKDDPNLLALAQDNQPGGNANALALAALREAPLDALGGQTFGQSYESIVFGVASQIGSARTEAEAAGAIAETLQAQRDALSGVSLDEEAVALLNYQRSYQGAARLIAAVDEMMQSILQLV